MAGGDCTVYFEDTRWLQGWRAHGRLELEPYCLHFGKWLVQRIHVTDIVAIHIIKQAYSMDDSLNVPHWVWGSTCQREYHIGILDCATVPKSILQGKAERTSC